MSDDLTTSVWDDLPRPILSALPDERNPFAEDNPFAEGESHSLTPQTPELNPHDPSSALSVPEEQPEPKTASRANLQGTNLVLLSELAGSSPTVAMDVAVSGSLFGDLGAAEGKLTPEEPEAAPAKRTRRRVGVARARRVPTTASDPLGSPTKPPALKEAPPLGTGQSPAEILAQAADSPLFPIGQFPGLELGELGKIPGELGKIPGELEESPGATPSEHPSAASVEPIPFTVTVGDPVKVSSSTSAHIVYTITSHSSLGSGVVTRRYRDFRWIYHQLQNNHPGCIIPPPPAKQAVGRFNEEFVEARRAALETMLQKTARSARLQADADFLMFLQSDAFGADAKARELASGSSASTADEDDDELPGFMSSFRALGFTAAPRYTEAEPWVLQKRADLERLETNLAAIARALELVVQQRRELAAMAGEFAVMMEELAALDASGDIFRASTVGVLGAFGKAQERVRGLVERSALQDMLTIGNTVDEYVRLVGSAKHCFKQRVRAKLAVMALEADLAKIERLAVRLRAAGAQPDDQAERQRAKIEAANLRAAAITSDLKRELVAFETAKVEDLRNAVETFLESNVELQKESIELWESFYERF